ncbi:telomeric repeat-binding factor 2-interacting protein 1 [Numida meleagris]|uniref:telomeric repeat-binding factor 2-interacting protein 1 n=1 Tax=Numida meleagris TaxID=8996 RepID=UPI000B3DEABF|nr:telomeric repeat-binding factor 2-interacting protein 1 [Numida meleagris]
MPRSDGWSSGFAHRSARRTLHLTCPALPFHSSPAPPARPPSLFTEARLGVRRIELAFRRGRHLPSSVPRFRHRCACAASAEMAAPSRKVFVWDDGTPMRFYIRPGMAKLRLAPLLLAGGAGLCRVQEPGAVHLVQPGELAPDGAVSTEYVVACVERQRRLPLDLYRQSGPAPLTASPRGRLPFTEAEDAALLQAVRERSGARVSGTTLWKELECAGLTRHSWQAMRDRYLRHLRPLYREPQQTEEAAAPMGIFEAANREFESSGSESDTSDTPEELPMQNGEGMFSGEAVSGLKDCALPTAQEENKQTHTCPDSSKVEEAAQIIQHFVEEFHTDLLTVMQAFLKNSGEVEATSYYLHAGQRSDGYPVWSREDDLELQKDDEDVRSKLIAKFGAENVARRVAFRKS